MHHTFWPWIKARRPVGPLCLTAAVGSWPPRNRSFLRSCRAPVKSNTIPRRSGTASCRWRARRWTRPQLGPDADCRHRHHEPARNHDPVGTRLGQADPPCHRLAEPRERGRSASNCAAAGCEPVIRQKTGLLLDPYFSGTKIRHLLDLYPVAARAGRARRGAVRHRRLVSDLASDRRATPRDRREQRQPHAAAQSRTRSTGTTNCCRSSACRARCCPEVRPSSHVYGQLRRVALRPRDPDRRRCGRSAGGHVRTGLLRAGRGQEHVRHRLLPAAQHGPHPVPSQHNLLTTVGWQVNGQVTLLPRRFGVHRRRGGPMAARRAGPDQEFAGN